MDELGIYLGDSIGRAQQYIGCKWGGRKRGPVFSTKGFTTEVPFCEMSRMERKELFVCWEETDCIVLDLLRQKRCDSFPWTMEM